MGAHVFCLLMYCLDVIVLFSARPIHMDIRKQGDSILVRIAPQLPTHLWCAAQVLLKGARVRACVCVCVRTCVRA